MLSYGSSVPGGIFMPILVLGALLGIICANIMIKSQIILPTYLPFTAIMLLTEMIGTVQQVLPMIIVTFVAYYILDILGGKPIYEDLRLQMNYHKNIDK